MSYVATNIDPGASPSVPVATVSEGGANLQVVKTAGAASATVGRVTITQTATLIAAANATRKVIRIQSHGMFDIDLGGSGVVAGAGFRLMGSDGAMVELTHKGAIYGIVATGLTTTISFVEESD
jgi:hypothetical protein